MLIDALMQKIDFARLRREMVDHQIAGRGVHSPAVLDAMRAVPREAFVPHHLQVFAYEDTALNVAPGRTLEQPYLIALMLHSLGLEGGEEVLDVGSGTGYAAALLARTARSVYCVEPDDALAVQAAALFSRLGQYNVHVRHGNAAWREHAPFDAIAVHVGAGEVPEALMRQLRVGGRLVMAVGVDLQVRELVRVTRLSEEHFQTEDIADVRIAPVPVERFGAPGSAPTRQVGGTVGASPDCALAAAIAAHCERFATPGTANLDGLIERIGDARIVLLGEATHGTSEFYRMRERISRDLIERKGFSFIAVECDWPDAARIDQYVRDATVATPQWTAFARFPTWMWRNQEMRSFVEWLRSHNVRDDVRAKAAFYGLDLYSLHRSIRSVLGYLDDVDPPTAAIARRRYACLSRWRADPAGFGDAALGGAARSCERDVVANLTELLKKQQAYAGHDGPRFLDAVQNARLVANAERYYRTMYFGSRAAWNLRDRHMYETLLDLLEFHGPHSKAIVWAHNSHIGDSAATEMALRGEFNIGRLCRERFGRAACLIGFGTDSGEVAAASNWDAPMQVMPLRHAVAGSYERLFHESGAARFVLPLRSGASGTWLDALYEPRLERAVGVIYRPEAELQSHYFRAELPHQFDEYIWFDRTQAVSPLRTEEVEGVPETYPFGL